ncbi:hypothetical protein [Serratia marcescens]|uniref:hypothetical protein n=1 Tax=Serratia marcescens TaxID=615 RepID=UPI003879389B
MKTTEWELIDELQNSYKKLIRSDLINAEIFSYTLNRGEDLELLGEFTYQGSAKNLHSQLDGNRNKHPVGTVRIDESQIVLANNYLADRRVILTGVSSNGYSIITSENGTCELKETYKIQSIKSDYKNKNETEFLIEWIANLSIAQYMWPDSITTERKTKSTKKLSSKRHSITLSSDKDKNGSSSKCCHINIQGVNIYFGITDESKLNEIQRPGFIFYEGNPEADLRAKIRQALSFIIGSNILFLGSSELDKDLHIVGFEAYTPNSMGGLFIQNRHPPSSRLMSAESRYYIADGDIISEMVSNFILNYDTYDFNHILWLYWHAVIAPAHLKAVCFGAVLEFTQKKLIDNKRVTLKKSLIDKKDWKHISNEIREIIEKNEHIDETSRKVLLNKISNLNSTPQSILTKKFFELLDLKLSDKEINSYSRRNDAAHGSKTPGDNFISLIRDSKLLHILCNRIIIRILALADNYTDFYTIGHPFREISEPISE